MGMVLIELNELNFDYIKKYFKFKKLSALKKISDNIIITNSESDPKLLEPWIQWHSIHTGETAEEHKVFRLGDSIFCNKKQIFEELEEKNLKIGIISAMNAKNNLKKPSYFIPDPWTNTKSDQSFFSTIISSVLRDFVNNNANGKHSKKNYIYLFLIFIKFVRLKNYYYFLKVFFKSFFGKWRRALFLDMLIHEIHFQFLKSKKTDFSCVFFNAGAHIQHHYLLNSILNMSNFKNPEFIVKNNQDPFSEALDVYNKILEDYLLNSENLIITTGLTQTIVENPHYYYRLKNHEEFLKRININFSNVEPRMSRDFLINFLDNRSRDSAHEVLNKIKINNSFLFGVLDKREKSIFVTLTYDKKINKDDFIILNNMNLKIYSEVVFVAIKNGFHNSKGFFYAKGKISQKFSDLQKINIFDIKDKIIKFYAS